jgi:hypothetical protein
MFAPDVERWLKGNSTPGHQQYIDSSRAETASLLRAVGVPEGTQLAHFYLHYGSFTCRGWYELNEPDQIADATDYAREEWGVPEGFIALSGFEGEGVVLYALESGAVYDVELGKLDDFLNGSLEPIAPTFEGYLRWCMERGDR